MSGMVTRIQRYSIHDGPGIRTVMFLKGCDLECQWPCLAFRFGVYYGLIALLGHNTTVQLAPGLETKCIGDHPQIGGGVSSRRTASVAVSSGSGRN